MIEIIDVEIRNMGHAVSLLDEWAKAYRVLERKYEALELRRLIEHHERLLAKSALDQHEIAETA